MDHVESPATEAANDPEYEAIDESQCIAVHWHAVFDSCGVTVLNAEDFTPATQQAITQTIREALASEAFARLAYPALHALTAGPFARIVQSAAETEDRGAQEQP